MKRIALLIAFLLYYLLPSSHGQEIKSAPGSGYQIHLKQPAKEIKLLMYEKNFLPIQGKLSEDKKSIIMQQYEIGNKVRIKVIYDDDTEEEFTKSPCYIDPVIT